MKRIVVPIVAIASLLVLNVGTVSAAPKCKKAARIAVEAIEGSITDPTLGGDATGFAHARQVKAPPGSRKPIKAWFIAGRIEGGTFDGQVDTWARIVLRPGASGLYAAVDDVAKSVSDLGIDFDPYSYTNPSSAAYDRVVACAT